jgi:hypothetical protein
VAAPESRPTGEIEFLDVAGELGIDVTTLCGNADTEHILETLGSGVAVADYDGDDDLDIYVGTAQTRDDWLAGRRPASNALYRNDGEGGFTNVTEQAGVGHRGWTQGVYFVDYDNDGDKDLFVTCWGPNVLYRNEGDGSFTDVTTSSGLGGSEEWSAGASFGDLDQDGDLDLYLANYCVYSFRNPPKGGAQINW